MAPILSTMHMWVVWTDIALEHEEAASAARARGLPFRPPSEESHLFSAALSDEMKASMVAISAAAHAIDAFYGATKQLVQLPSSTTNACTKKRPTRWNCIFETLKFGYSLGNKTRSWPDDFQWLYKSRGASVHFHEEQGELEQHPTGTYTSPELVTYSLEQAGRAVDLLLDVLSTCLKNPKPAALAVYVAPFEHELIRLTEKRGKGTSAPSSGSQP